MACVSDGDTITVLQKGQAERIRLHEIDSPEKRQAFGNRAKQFTSNVVLAKTVTAQAVDRDRYGRTVGNFRIGVIVTFKIYQQVPA